MSPLYSLLMGMWLSARFVHPPDEPIQIRMKPDGDELLIQSASTGNVVARWTFSSLYKADESTNRTYALRSSAHEATVEITDLDAMRALDWLWRLPAQKAKDPRKTLAWIFGGITIVTIGLMLSIFFFLDHLSESWESKLFRDRTVFPDSSLCRSQLGSDALAAIVKPLLEVRSGSEPLRLSVYKSETFETFAFPAHRLFLSSGLLSQLANPSELIGIIAHQMEHVFRRHPLAAFKRESIVTPFLRLMIGSDKERGLDPSLLQLFIRPQLSAAEEQAVREATVARLKSLNLDPNGLTQLFSRMRAQGEFPSFYTDHHMDKLKPTPALASPTDDLDSDWLALKKICDD